MFKRLQTPILLILLLLIIPPFIYFFNYSQPVSLNIDNKTNYELPFPGLLPDHPLYLLKASRDQVLVFVIRDYEKKARLQLELSDKRVRAGELLVDENKHELAVNTFSKGERYFEQTIETLSAAKIQGQTPTASLLDQMTRSNKKHNEILMRSSKELKGSLKERLSFVITLNNQNSGNLQSLK